MGAGRSQRITATVGKVERRYVADVHGKRIMACWDRASIWVEITGPEGGNAWPMAPSIARELSEALPRAVEIAKACESGDHPMKDTIPHLSLMSAERVDVASKDRVREFFTYEREDGSLAVNEAGVGFLDEDEVRELAERMRGTSP